MEIFKKRETVVQNIAYMAIMAAISAVLVLISALVPFMIFISVFILSLGNAIVALLCKKRYYPIYAVVTAGLCLLVTSGIQIFDTIFYVIPSLITGFVFGLLIEKRVPSIYVILITSVVQYIITYLTFLTIDAIFPDRQIFNILFAVLPILEMEFRDIFAHEFMFILAFVQNIFTYFIIKWQIHKIGYEFNLYVDRKYIICIINILLIGLAIGMMYVYPPMTYVLMSLNMPITVYQIIEILYSKNKFNYIALGFSFAIFLFVFVFTYTYIHHPMAIILLSTIYGLVSAIYFANYLFIKKTKVDKINE